MSSIERRVNVGPAERGLSVALGLAAGSAALRRRSVGSALLALAGGYLIYRGAGGHCPISRALGVTGSEVGRTVSACSQITVQRPIGEVYRFWREPVSVPEFSRYLEQVEPLGNELWRCWAHGPLGGRVAWDMRLTVDEENSRVAWCAVEGAALPSALEVRLSEGPAGTQVHVDTWLVPPAPSVVSAALRRSETSRPLRRAGLNPSELLEAELRRLRQYLETGETATTAGQSSGRERLPAGAD